MYAFTLSRGSSESAELVNGATIHAKNEVWYKLKRIQKENKIGKGNTILYVREKVETLNLHDKEPECTYVNFWSSESKHYLIKELYFVT